MSEDKKTCPRCNGKREVKDEGSGFRKSVGVFVLFGIPAPMSDSMKRCPRCYGKGIIDG